MRIRIMAALPKAGGVIAVAAAFSGSACATEGAGSIYPNGIESFVAAALPPPGFYAIVYGTHYRATALRDDQGKDIAGAIGGFRAEVNAAVSRFLWTTDEQVLGGQLAFQFILPVLDVDVRMGPRQQRKTGIGDVNLAAALGYHVSEQLHYVVALEVNAPTGRFERDDIANVGRNHWNLEPVLAMTYMQPSGLNADLKLMADYNFRNTDTDYKSGRELHADYALGWGLGNGWVLGAGGYLYRQISDDEQGGLKIHGNRGRAFAIGPLVKFQSTSGWLVTAKYENQSGVRNRPDGSAFWVKAFLPF